MQQSTLIIKREKSQSVSKLSFHAGESLLALCERAGIEIVTPCGGKGICGKCRVRFLAGAPMPNPMERRCLTAEELRQGYRLACKTILSSDCEILLPGLQTLDAVGMEIDVSWKETEPVLRQKVNAGKYFVIADIGTTTIVMEKRRVCDGRATAVYHAVNAQRKYGADVLSRLEASVLGKSKELSQLLYSQLADGLQQLKSGQNEETDTEIDQEVEKQAAADIQFIIIAANTSMIHLLMEYDVKNLCRAPFVPRTLDEIKTQIDGVDAYIMPGISAFVGADLLAGMYAAVYLKHKPEQKENTISLLIDLGTNAEMILFDEKKAICTSAAAGCAFDSISGAVDVYGSNIISLLADLLAQGKIDRHGTLQDEFFDSGVTVILKTDGCGKKEVNITQEQIRQMQLAKAAVRCGIDYLTEKFGCQTEDISQVYLAGGFGFYLDVAAAVRVGLLPETCRNITISCGNTALTGAALYAKEKLLKKSLPDGLNYVNQLTFEPINLAQQSDFSQRYISYLDF